ncbi:hypothetical protein QJQ45_012884 [Haematococcus lacustris]|nr:hypothetical protein QJQ45_012884 [Haematococcus lacustris]
MAGPHNLAHSPDYSLTHPKQPAVNHSLEARSGHDSVSSAQLGCSQPPGPHSLAPPPALTPSTKPAPGDATAPSQTIAPSSGSGSDLGPGLIGAGSTKPAVSCQEGLQVAPLLHPTLFDPTAPDPVLPHSAPSSPTPLHQARPAEAAAALARLHALLRQPRPGPRPQVAPAAPLSRLRLPPAPSHSPQWSPSNLLAPPAVPPTARASLMPSICPSLDLCLPTLLDSAQFGKSSHSRPRPRMVHPHGGPMSGPRGGLGAEGVAQWGAHAEQDRLSLGTSLTEPWASELLMQSSLSLPGPPGGQEGGSLLLISLLGMQ